MVFEKKRPGAIIPMALFHFSEQTVGSKTFIFSVQADGREGDRISIDLSTGAIVELSKGKRFSARQIPDFMLDILKAGGLVEYLKKR